jgi:ABC-type Fe3+/spermidine/putrescine transport system ATPase subunit
LRGGQSVPGAHSSTQAVKLIDTFVIATTGDSLQAGHKQRSYDKQKSQFHSIILFLHSTITVMANI